MPYNRHASVMSSEYDSAFRILVTAGWAHKTQGAVDEAIGHLSALHLDAPSNERDVHEDYAAVLSGEGEPVPSPGWYIVHENELGIIVVFSYDNEGDLEADWANAEAESLSYHQQDYEDSFDPALINMEEENA